MSNFFPCVPINTHNRHLRVCGNRKKNRTPKIYQLTSTIPGNTAQLNNIKANNKKLNAVQKSAAI